MRTCVSEIPTRCAAAGSAIAQESATTALSAHISGHRRARALFRKRLCMAPHLGGRTRAAPAYLMISS